MSEIRSKTTWQNRKLLEPQFTQMKCRTCATPTKETRSAVAVFICVHLCNLWFASFFAFRLFAVAAFKMGSQMKNKTRPFQAKLFALLLLLSGAVMALLGTSAGAYYVCAACLLLQAVLVWQGAGFKVFKGILVLNLIAGSVMILALWLGDALHLPKLDISGAMLLGNLLFGGPLMSILAAPILGALRMSKALPLWFAA